jgi:hypothetical protein
MTETALERASDSGLLVSNVQQCKRIEILLSSDMMMTVDGAADIVLGVREYAGDSCINGSLRFSRILNAGMVEIARSQFMQTPPFLNFAKSRT